MRLIIWIAISIMVGVVLAGPVDLENQVSPTERFALVKNFTKIVA